VLFVNCFFFGSRDARYHCIASYRALVQKDFAKNLWIPYTNLFPKNLPHKVIHGVVSGVYHDHVILSTDSVSSTSRIDFDYLVIATGSMVPSPAKWKVKDSTEGIRLMDKAREDVERSQSIVIVGGGACGTEMAGELKYAYPAKKVTLIHGKASLVDYPNFPQSFKDEAKRYLEKRGVEVILNEKIEIEGLTRENSIQKADRTIFLSNSDRRIESDLQFFSIGLQAQTGLLSTLQLPSIQGENADTTNKNHDFKAESLLDPTSKAIRVRTTLQLDHAGFPNIFAIGDASNADPVPTAMSAIAAGETSARNIVKLIKKARRVEAGETEPPEHDGFHCHAWAKLEDYRHIQTLMVLTMNPSGGVCQLPVLGTWFGSLGAWLVKSRDLFSGRFWREMNMPRK